MSGAENKKPRILCLSGSPRPGGNSHRLAECFRDGAASAGAEAVLIRVSDLNIQPCRGCLRCNVLGRCAIKGDDFPGVAELFAGAAGVLFASPVWFHHVSSPLKVLLDRFRSMIQVRLVEGGAGLEHAARFGVKEYALILSMGGAWDRGVAEITSLVGFLSELAGGQGEVRTLVGKRLALAGQVGMDEAELAGALSKLGLDPARAGAMRDENMRLLENARAMGAAMARSIMKGEAGASP